MSNFERLFMARIVRTAASIPFTPITIYTILNENRRNEFECFHSHSFADISKYIIYSRIFMRLNMCNKVYLGIFGATRPRRKKQQIELIKRQ